MSDLTVGVGRYYQIHLDDGSKTLIEVLEWRSEVIAGFDEWLVREILSGAEALIWRNRFRRELNEMEILALMASDEPIKL